MDASALRNFLLKEVESRPIHISASKLARVESERRPIKIFQYSDGSIERSVKDDFGYGNKLRKTSSVSSSDSGFSMTPSSPNLPLQFLSPAPYVSVDHLLGSSSGNGQDEVTSGDENDSLLRHSSPSPPPLPSSRPPSFINKRNIHPHLDDETAANTLRDRSEFMSDDNINGDVQHFSTDAFNSGDQTSDSEGYHDDTTIPQCDSYSLNIPIEISKCDGSIKTVRSSIKKGTVHDMKQLFKVKTKRSKRVKEEAVSHAEKDSHPKRDNSDLNISTTPMSNNVSTSVQKKKRKPGNLSIGDMLEKSNFYSDLDEQDYFPNDNSSTKETVSETFDTKSIVLNQDLLEDHSSNTTQHNDEIYVQSSECQPHTKASSYNDPSAFSTSQERNKNSRNSKNASSPFEIENSTKLAKQNVLLELELLDCFRSVEEEDKGDSSFMVDEFKLSHNENRNDEGTKHTRNEISCLEARNLGVQPNIEKPNTPSVSVNTTSIDNGGESNALLYNGDTSYTCDVHSTDDAWTQNTNYGTESKVKLNQTEPRNQTDMVSFKTDNGDDHKSKDRVCMNNHAAESPSDATYNYVSNPYDDQAEELDSSFCNKGETTKTQTGDLSVFIAKREIITDDRSGAYENFQSYAATGARRESKESKNTVNCDKNSDLSNESSDDDDYQYFDRGNRKEQSAFGEQTFPKVVYEVYENDSRNDESTNEIKSNKKLIKVDGDGTFTPKRDDLCNKNVVKVRSKSRSAYRDSGSLGLGISDTYYVSNSEKDVYCETNDSTVQVTMTSGDKHTRQRAVSPVLINDLKVTNESVVGNFNTYEYKQSEVDKIQNYNSDDQRSETDQICERNDEDFPSESSYVADKRSIEASYGELSDSDEKLDSDKSINSADGDKVIQVKRDLNQVNDSFNSESTFSNNLPDISDLSGEEAAELGEREGTENKYDNLNSSNLVDDLRGVADVAILCSGILNQKAEDDPQKNYEYGQGETLKPWLTDENTPVTNDKALNTSSVYSQECNKADTSDNKLPTVISHAKDSSSHAYLSSGKHTSHVTSNLTSALTNTVQANQVTNCSDTSTGARTDHNRDIPEFYSLPDTLESSKIVTLKEIPARRRRMPERSSGYTSSDSETSSYTGGRRVSTRTETLQSSKGGKITELKEGELESNIHVQHLAETISKLTGDNTDEYLPEINQTVTKIPGGNLVITTLTHKVVEEEEEEDENKTKKVPDDQNDRYIVQDHTGQYYYVEDITDETQESAYYSSSGTQNSSYDGYGQNSFNGIQNLQAVGKSTIGYDTAEEVLLGLYNSPGTMEIHEYDEREYEERSGQYTGALQPYGMTNNSSLNKQTTTYEYDNNIKRPVPHNIGSSTVKTMKHMYEMETAAPWVTDGTTSQQMQDGECENEIKRESMQTTETHADQQGMNSMCAAYMLQSSASVIPPVLQPPVVPPPVIYPPVVPQYRVAKVDFTPAPILTSTPQVTESHTQTDLVEEKETKVDRERPIFKTVALVKGPYEIPKWKQTKEREEDSMQYKVVNSRASEPVQEETVEYEENVKTMSTYKMEKTGFDENSNLTMPHYVNHPAEQQRFRTEKVFQINGTSPSPSPQKSFQTKINVGSLSRDLEALRRPPEHTHYEYIKETNRDGGFYANDELDRPSDMRVVRGNILIKNTMDQDLDDYNDNINLFDRTFNMSKDNPLYQSDEDLYKRYEREKELERYRQQRLDDRLNQDITFETVDRFTKSKEVKRVQEKQRPKKNLSQLLLSRISSLDSKDIRQHIDVKHHNEDIFGDINLIHADGTRGRSSGTSNFDSVNENVDLVMKDGKAFITIKVTAERISPIDLEFNVWRKSQAIVTRVIEIDFFANEQRRRLYENVMDRAGRSDREYERLGTRRHGSHGYKAGETVLSSQETLDLFTEIMEAAEGEGDNEDITIKTSQRKTFVPRNNMDFLY